MTFAVGDFVTWRDEGDEGNFSTCLVQNAEKLARCKAEYGPGPFEIKRVYKPSGGITALMSPEFLYLKGCEGEGGFPLHYLKAA